MLLVYIPAEAAQLLLDHGATPNILHIEEGTPLTLQLKQKRLAVAECILKSDPSLVDEMFTNVSSEQHNHYSALHNCAWDGYVEGIELLLRYGADHRLVTPDGNTAVGLACHADWLTCAMYLLKLGCDTNCQDHDGDTALLYATCNGNWALVNSLLSHGADPGLGNKNNVTPLWNAVYSRSLESVRSLLLLNANPDIPCRGCNIFDRDNINIYDTPVSPLFVAIHQEESSIAKTLVSAGCYMNALKFSIPNFHMYVDEWDDDDDKKWFEHVSSNPPSLLWWSKRAVRRSLPVNPKSIIESLPIPSSLKLYIQHI